MAKVQLKCPETGEPIDIRDLEPGAGTKAYGFSRPVACPHCGNEHAWTSGHLGEAEVALHNSPDATCVLVEGTRDGITATALP
jgi:hypothetical protein